MTWVAADDSGTPIPGFEYGTFVAYQMADGSERTGMIIVQGTDKIGDVHKIQDDDNPDGELVKISPQFVRRLSD
ncbi:hypothetical protein SEA_ZUKO_33 [Streptomyces phage Zuko]|uniref:Uncharacterized protein n=1 Tax=Streptomyces phage Zuko TaxID=2601695 RepID=A0A5J6D785_9CAUD|nr:hypothetical protein PP630_gp033 [Streptomyces phage Zuko]QEQ93611.1 hypothetical protein SEA_ZUKO_33 [Streptomyces phage Zuko]